MKTKPCGLEVEEESIIAFKNLHIHQLFVTINGVTMVKTDYEEAIVLSTGLTQRFGPMEFTGLTDEPVIHSRMNEPVFQAKFIE